MQSKTMETDCRKDENRICAVPKEEKLGFCDLCILGAVEAPDDKGENVMQINETQLKQVNTQIGRLIAADNFYGKRLKAAGVEKVETVEDFLKLPFSE